MAKGFSKMQPDPLKIWSKQCSSMKVAVCELWQVASTDLKLYEHEDSAVQFEFAEADLEA